MPQDTTRTTPPAARADFLGLDARHARLLGQLAARLHRHVQGRHHQPAATSPAAGRQFVVDLDADTDPVDVYLALLQGGAALAHSQHALAALTAAHMWTLLDQAATALGRHPDLTDPDRELISALQQMGELRDLPIVHVPAVGVELHEELEAAREVTAALDALDEATASGDPRQGQLLPAASGPGARGVPRPGRRARPRPHRPVRPGHFHTDSP